jgi:hypothetical protein
MRLKYAGAPELTAAHSGRLLVRVKR